MRIPGRLVTAATVAVLAAAMTSSAQAQRTRRDSSTAQRVTALLGAIAHDSMEGRDTGSRGGAAAARWIAAQLQQAGLQPAGDSGWFQRVPVAYQSITNPQNNQVRRVMRLQPDFAARDTFPVADRVNAVNVVGILRGSDPALRDEAIVIDAHYDHVGRVGAGACRTTGADSVCNGADDDASGVVAVIEAARMLASASPAPKRTIVFLLVTGEERGTLGSRWYLDHPVVPIAATVANLEIEMIGRPDSLAGGAGKAWLTGFERSTMGAMLRENGIALVADPRPDQHFFERSDNIIFAYQGVPAHTISSYSMHSEYHTPADEVSRVDASHMAAVINATTRAARLLADGAAPAWVEGGRPVRPAPRRTP